jgi:CheY-like chemotaxis protein
MKKATESRDIAAMKTVEELMHLVHSGERRTEDIPPIVLLVDDHPDTLEIYDACLSAQGYWVARAANGLEALECAQDLRPDAVVTDIGLGGDMDGTDLLRELRADAALREIPVLVVTGRGPRELPSLAGIDTAGLLLKPVAPETLASRVASVLRTSPSLSARKPLGSFAALPPQPASEARIVTKAPAPSPDKKRRTCPKCGAGLTWVETRRCDGVMCDYYRACSHGCGLFFFNRALREWETLLGHESPS